MIGRLRGTVVAKGAEGLLLEAGGVGFEVVMAPRGLGELPPLGETAVVHTHLHLREDQVALFGFPTAEERDLFRILLGATGGGPRRGPPRPPPPSPVAGPPAPAPGLSPRRRCR